ncbi:hypothetical protein [Xylella fastidiosa]|nr:hypothetical protein [Xylella fastidiosa]MCP8325512.1 hypothetical protein [Xylella fastidiosa subsp. multiplex]MDC6413777.1 hypothetical protein [Xylella fastidiosa subsp. multiplex]MDD0861573.1 hypothetical protein [Xylella fastidiosa subsp. multiplex]MDD0862989.1 hypothetical protein [Xylella fastidiosa subsp. multiplex]MDD0865831.1 hypothetical protein [Xylella fastidiosa subsp. multiplex]
MAARLQRLSIGRASFYCLLRRQSRRPLCVLFLVMYPGTILFVGYPYRGFHLALNVPIRDFFAVLMCVYCDDWLYLLVLLWRSALG